jgi:hypothetical protein
MPNTFLYHEDNRLSASTNLLVSLHHPRSIISVLPPTTLPERYKSQMQADAGVS